MADQKLSFNEEASALRWFLLPSEAQSILRGETPGSARVPFTPRKYSKENKDYGYQHFSTVPNKPASRTTTEDCNVVDAPLCKINEVKRGLESDSDDGPSDSESDNFNLAMAPYEEEDTDENSASLRSLSLDTLWKTPGKNIIKPTLEAVMRYKMINNGDRVLVCVSGGKDSLSLLHTLRHHQQRSKRFGVEFDLGVVTVDPGSSAYDPSVLIPYMNQLGIPYFYERQCKWF